MLDFVSGLKSWVERGQGQSLMRKEWHTFPCYIQEQRVANRCGCPALSSLLPWVLTSISNRMARLHNPVNTTTTRNRWVSERVSQPAITCPVIGMHHSNPLVFREAALQIIGLHSFDSGVNLINISTTWNPLTTSLGSNPSRKSLVQTSRFIPDGSCGHSVLDSTYLYRFKLLSAVC